LVQLLAWRRPELATGLVLVDPAHEQVAGVLPRSEGPYCVPALLACQVQSTTAPPVKLISLAVMVRAQSDAAKAAMLATSS
jgi:pimeloyl-ACP methyl ester carboxylesterase